MKKNKTWWLLRKYHRFFYITLGFIMSVFILGYLFYWMALNRVFLGVDPKKNEFLTFENTVTGVLKDRGIYLNTPTPHYIEPVSGVLVTPNAIYKYTRIIVMEATAYYPGMNSRSPGKGLTCTGKKARYGLVAVDPKVIPLGTFLYIEGYGKAEAADTGGAIKGNKIDLCFTTYREAIGFGRRMVTVYVLAL